jgi:hypothetical protein
MYYPWSETDRQTDFQAIRPLSMDPVRCGRVWCTTREQEVPTAPVVHRLLETGSVDGFCGAPPAGNRKCRRLLQCTTCWQPEVLTAPAVHHLLPTGSADGFCSAPPATNSFYGASSAANRKCRRLLRCITCWQPEVLTASAMHLLLPTGSADGFCSAPPAGNCKS